MRFRVVTATLAAALALCGACVNGYMANRGLHYITNADGEQVLVRSSPPSPAAYEAYLRARLALEREGADLDAARTQAFVALRWQPNDPQLWTLLAEIEWRAGDTIAAEAALEQALRLRPGFVEALALRSELADTASASPSPPERP